jgi:hypothetical protein
LGVNPDAAKELGIVMSFGGLVEDLKTAVYANIRIYVSWKFAPVPTPNTN